MYQIFRPKRVHETSMYSGCKGCVPVINVVVTCEIKLVKNYFANVSVKKLFQRLEICLKPFQNYSTSLLQLMNILKHVY